MAAFATIAVIWGFTFLNIRAEFNLFLLRPCPYAEQTPVTALTFYQHLPARDVQQRQAHRKPSLVIWLYLQSDILFRLR